MVPVSGGLGGGGVRGATRRPPVVLLQLSRSFLLLVLPPSVGQIETDRHTGPAVNLPLKQRRDGGGGAGGEGGGQQTTAATSGKKNRE